MNKIFIDPNSLTLKSNWSVASDVATTTGFATVTEIDGRLSAYSDQETPEEMKRVFKGCFPNVRFIDPT